MCNWKRSSGIHETYHLVDVFWNFSPFNLIYKSNSGGVCLSVWAVPGRFFQSLPVPYGVSPDVTSPDVTDYREKRNQGQSDFLRQKIWYTRKKYLGLGQPKIFFFVFFLYWPKLPFFSFSYCPSRLRGWMKCPSNLMTGRI